MKTPPISIIQLGGLGVLFREANPTPPLCCDGTASNPCAFDCF